MKNALVAALLGLTVGGAGAIAGELPAGARLSGQFERTPDAIISQGDDKTGARITGTIDDPQLALRLTGKTGPKTLGVTVTLKDAAGAGTVVMIRPTTEKIGGVDYPDLTLALGWKGGWGRKYVRPHPGFYKPEEFAKHKAEWEQLPPASRHSFELELRPTGDGRLELWFDGQFMNYLPQPEPAVRYEIALVPGASVSSLKFENISNDDHLNLPVRAEANPAGTSNARIELDPAAPLPRAFAKLNHENAQGIAVGGLGNFAALQVDDLVSMFWRRQATYNLFEQKMFAIPLDLYSQATMLCAINGKPGAVPELTFRVTRYGGNRGDAMADTIVRVPVGETSNDPNARRVGTLVDGNHRTPLWLIRVPIKNGFIEDLLHRDQFRDKNLGTWQYLDIELLDPLANVDAAEAFPPSLAQNNRAFRPAKQNVPSDVTVYGIQLERGPVDLTVRSNIGIQAFYSSDQPEFVAKLQAVLAGDYSLDWQFADVDGKIVDQGKQTVRLAADETLDVKIPVRSGVGWYSARFRIRDSQKVEQMDYRTSYVMLPPDKRKVGLESPFYGWWFQKNQRSDVKLEEAGPLMQRLGIRRVGLSADMPENLTMKYGFTDSTINWGGARLALLDYRDGKKTLPDAIAAQEAYIRGQLALWPSMDRMLVFHESGGKGAPFPSEIWGESAVNQGAAHDENSPEALLAKEGGGAAAVPSTQAPGEWQQNWPSRIEYLKAMTKMVREKFPQLKMQFGNDGNSLAIMGELFRQKFPRELMDTIAIEDLGQTIPPERAVIGGFQSAWFLRETARKMGYGDIPITACTEWIGRMTERLGNQKQAEWKVRDGLLALAYGFDTISIAGLADAGSGYYFTGWANGGLCTRYPNFAPKPSYAAIATLTQVLDRAKFERWMPAGSTALYVAEFRQDDQWVYALWTPRGDREMTAIFPSNEKRPLIDLYGRTKELTGKQLTLTASTAAQYVVSKDRMESVIAGAASFPQDPVPQDPGQTIPLESVNEVSIVANPRIEESSKARPELIPQLRQGDFELREVNDAEKGKCLEVELKPTRSLRWAMEHEYVYLQFKTPVQTSAKNAGLWVKGNCSWGEVDLQAAGKAPWLGNGDTDFRWRGEATLNFEGWNLIRFPEPGTAPAQETVVNGILIRLPRQTLYGTEMVPVENLKIRLKSLLFY